MQVKFKTAELKDTVSLARKGVGNNRLLPLTQMTEISGDGRYFKFKTTDKNNILDTYIGYEGEAFEPVCVMADTFFKLISTIVYEETIIEIGKSVNVSTEKGDYSFDVITDEEGNVNFKTLYQDDLDWEEESYKFSTKQFSEIAKSNKGCLDLEHPTLSNYAIRYGYCYTTDSAILGFHTVTLPDMVINNKAVDILASATGEGMLRYSVDKTFVLFEGDNFKILSPLYTEDYPVGAIDKYRKMDFEDETGFFDIEDFKRAIKNVSLFSSIYDRNAIIVKFDSTEGITICSKNGEAKEIVRCDIDLGETIFIDSVLLLKALNSIEDDDVVIFYSKDFPVIKLAGDNTNIVVSLLNE